MNRPILHIFTLMLLFAASHSYATAKNIPLEGEPPQTLIKAIETLIEKTTEGGPTSEQQIKDPNTGKIKSSYKIYNLTLSTYEKNYLDDVRKAFEHDKNCGYSYTYFPKNTGTLYNVYIGDYKDEKINTRTSMNQEFYCLLVKNQENPILRDNYTLVIEEQKAGLSTIYDIKIFLVTSLRPDLVEKNDEDKSNNDLVIFTEGDKEIMKLKYNKFKTKLNTLESQLDSFIDAQKKSNSPSKYKKDIEKLQEEIDNISKEFIDEVVETYKRATGKKADDKK